MLFSLSFSHDFWVQVSCFESTKLLIKYNFPGSSAKVRPPQTITLKEVYVSFWKTEKSNGSSTHEKNETWCMIVIAFIIDTINVLKYGTLFQHWNKILKDLSLTRTGIPHEWKKARDERSVRKERQGMTEIKRSLQQHMETHWRAWESKSAGEQEGNWRDRVMEKTDGSDCPFQQNEQHFICQQNMAINWL